MNAMYRQITRDITVEACSYWNFHSMRCHDLEQKVITSCRFAINKYDYKLNFMIRELNDLNKRESVFYKRYLKYLPKTKAMKYLFSENFLSESLFYAREPIGPDWHAHTQSCANELADRR